MGDFSIKRYSGFFSLLAYIDTGLPRVQKFEISIILEKKTESGVDNGVNEILNNFEVKQNKKLFFQILIKFTKKIKKGS